MCKTEPLPLSSNLIYFLAAGRREQYNFNRQEFRMKIAEANNSINISQNIRDKQRFVWHPSNTEMKKLSRDLDFVIFKTESGADCPESC